jgi:hypothetical protein
VIEIESSTLEKLLLPLTTSADPTGALPEFGLTVGDREDPPVSMVDGEWSGGWVSVNGRVDALTPLIGASANPSSGLVIEQGVTYDLWVAWTVGVERPARRAFSFRAV